MNPAISLLCALIPLYAVSPRGIEGIDEFTDYVLERLELHQAALAPADSPPRQ